jgi:ribosomal protein S18 acetylase RimI-like enzyme
MPAPAHSPARGAPEHGHRVRGYRRGDLDTVLALVNADRLPGQPVATAGHLAEALAGRNAVDAAWWAELAGLRTDVLVNKAGQVHGVVSYARRPRDNAGVLLWLHVREHPGHVAALIDHVMARLQDCGSVHAFDFATALACGLEALPVRRRPVTAGALEQAGFTGRDLWSYMHRGLADLADLRDDPRAANLQIRATTAAERPGWTLTATCAHRPAAGGPDATDTAAVGEAVGGAPQAGVGVLWWLEVAPHHQGGGVGRALLNAVLRRLRAAGAQEAILYVDDDEPCGGPRDRCAAKQLYVSCGFVEIDRLVSFTCPAPSGHAGGPTTGVGVAAELAVDAVRARV